MEPGHFQLRFHRSCFWNHSNHHYRCSSKSDNLLSYSSYEENWKGDPLPGDCCQNCHCSPPYCCTLIHSCHLWCAYKSAIAVIEPAFWLVRSRALGVNMNIGLCSSSPHLREFAKWNRSSSIVHSRSFRRPYLFIWWFLYNVIIILDYWFIRARFMEINLKNYRYREFWKVDGGTYTFRVK